MADQEFDVIVIGAGPAGEVLAGRAAGRDLEVAIVEQELVGGECSFYACMPSKALLRPAEALEEIQRVPGAAEAVGGDLNVQATLERRDEVIHDLDDSAQLPWLESKDIPLFRGHGRLTGERQVEVETDEGTKTLTARKAVVIATGTGALMPPIDGLEDVAAWSNREITTTSEVPEKLIVLGAGPVGCEMAQAWRTLGSEVALIEAEGQLLHKYEPFVGEQLAEAFAERGIDLHISARASAATRADGKVEITLEDGESVTGSHLLVAIGRSPHTDDLGLETVGLEAGEFIEVDDRMAVGGHPWLYAIGDVNGRSLLTHMGKYQARVLADNLTGRDLRVEKDDEGSPQVVFTEPKVAAVGKTLAAAKDAGIDAVAVDVDTDATAGASFHGRNTGGTSRLVIDRERGVIVGATFTGYEAQEFLYAATIAVVGGVPLERLVHAIPTFPTRSEIWLNLYEEYGL